MVVTLHYPCLCAEVDADTAAYYVFTVQDLPNLDCVFGVVECAYYSSHGLERREGVDFRMFVDGAVDAVEVARCEDLGCL